MFSKCVPFRRGLKAGWYDDEVFDSNAFGLDIVLISIIFCISCQREMRMRMKRMKRTYHSLTKSPSNP